MQSVINFILANQVILAGVVVAILDLLFALKSDWAGNGILHSVYLFFKNIKDKVVG